MFRGEHVWTFELDWDGHMEVFTGLFCSTEGGLSGRQLKWLRKGRATKEQHHEVRGQTLLPVNLTGSRPRNI